MEWFQLNWGQECPVLTRSSPTGCALDKYVVAWLLTNVISLLGTGFNNGSRKRTKGDFFNFQQLTNKLMLCYDATCVSCVCVCVCISLFTWQREARIFFFLFYPAHCLFGIIANHLIILTETDTLNLISPPFVTRLFSLNTETGITTLISQKSHSPPV